MKIYYYEHDTIGNKRIRKEDWPNDVFRVVSPDEFNMIEDFCGWFGIPLLDGDLAELEEETNS